MNKFESHIIFILYIGWIGSFGSIFANKNTAQPYAKKKKKKLSPRGLQKIFIVQHKLYNSSLHTKPIQGIG